MAEIPNASETYNPADYQGMVDVRVDKKKHLIAKADNRTIERHTNKLGYFGCGRLKHNLDQKSQKCYLGTFQRGLGSSQGMLSNVVSKPR